MRLKKISKKELTELENEFDKLDPDFEIPPPNPETMEYLKRLVSWNSKDYNPLKDKHFVSDCVTSICIHSKPLILTAQQQQLLAIQFSNIDNVQVARKKINKICKQLEKIFYPDIKDQA